MLNKHHYLHIIELGIIAILVFQFVYLPYAAKDEYLTEKQPISIIPETITKILNSTDAVFDLNNLGCSIVNITEIAPSSSGAESGFLLKYDEFRKIAYNTKIVLLKQEQIYDYQKNKYDKIDVFITIWNGKYFVTSIEQFDKLTG